MTLIWAQHVLASRAIGERIQLLGLISQEIPSSPKGGSLIMKRRLSRKALSSPSPRDHLSTFLGSSASPGNSAGQGELTYGASILLQGTIWGPHVVPTL